MTPAKVSGAAGGPQAPGCTRPKGRGGGNAGTPAWAAASPKRGAGAALSSPPPAQILGSRPGREPAPFTPPGPRPSPRELGQPGEPQLAAPCPQGHGPRRRRRRRKGDIFPDSSRARSRTRKPPGPPPLALHPGAGRASGPRRAAPGGGQLPPVRPALPASAPPPP